jgi:hypothetical protein
MNDQAILTVITITVISIAIRLRVTRKRNKPEKRSK